ncbi:DUF523 and DUF1722 domain-containing protein [Clostridium sp. AL.422]|uniref:YbgA family protein n=1 Tax=Clostridium TaxID=1485 RepID=UPI00293DEDA8|nr:MULTISPECIES: DUF523 and DUF1722 domain-containing protein [unclassified Clostridium]MDV4151006.1 DUF523 and DUF1722 domain-containing protein [Clostridium sp. AL.422]
MLDINKPTILISKCIEGEPCRYDGAMIKDPFISRLKSYVNVIEVCPEVGIGLSTPRDSLRLIGDKNIINLVCSKTGENLTDKMISFSNDFLKSIDKSRIQGIILKGRSPSCGIKDVKLYNGIGKSSIINRNTSGIFAQKLMEEFGEIAIEDEGRLTNYNIREKFLTCLYANFNFGKVEEMNSVNELIKFQRQYKYLLMAYSPARQKELGKIVGSATKADIEDSIKEYKHVLSKALSISQRPMRNVNMLLHLFGYFSKELSKEEKAFFLDTLEKYQNKKVPFSLPLTIIKSWAIRFNNDYLLEQKIFESFPIELVDVTDSGKGI